MFGIGRCEEVKSSIFLDTATQKAPIEKLCHRTESKSPADEHVDLAEL